MQFGNRPPALKRKVSSYAATSASGSKDDRVQRSMRKAAVEALESRAYFSAVALYHLDETSGTAGDASGHAHTATLFTGASFVASDRTGGSGALSFNGSTGYAKATDANDLDGTAALSISLWVNPFLLDGNARGIISKRVNSNNNQSYSLFFTTGNKLAVDIDGTNNRFTSNYVFSAGVWTHVALTYDGNLPAADRVKLYINGTLDKTASETSAAIPNNASDLTLGLAGKLDEVGIYNEVLTAATVAQLAATPPPDAPAGLAADWQDGHAALQWVPSLGATSYTVYRAATASGLATAAPLQSGLTSAAFDDVGLTNYTRYYYAVTAVDSAGASAKSTPVLAVPHPTGAPMARYSFDDTAGATSAADSVGFVGAATLSSGAVITGAGGRGNGGNTLSVNGTTGYASVGDDEVLDHTNKLTLTAWVSPSIEDGVPRGVLSKRVGSGNQEAYALFVRNGHLEVDIDGIGDRFISGAPIPLNVWTHVAVVYDGTLPAAMRVQLFINGVLDQMAPESSAVIPDYNSPLYVGTLNSGTTSFKGLIDEARVYHDVLAASDITLLARRAPAVSSASGDGQVLLTWASVPGASTYNLYRTTSPSGEGRELINTGIAGTSWVVSAPNGVRYYYVVAPVDAVGEGDVSQPIAAMSHPAGTPIASYSFEDATGSSTATDSTGLGHTASLLNGPTLIASGRAGGGNALKFDGTNDYAAIADAPDLDNTNQLTLALWANPSTFGSDYRAVLAKRVTYDNNESYALLVAPDGRLAIDIDGTNNRFTSTNPLPLNSWTHITVVYDGTQPAAQRVRLYINGQLDKVAAESTARLPDYASDLYLGLRPLGAPSGTKFLGMLDDVRVYADALTDGQVAAVKGGGPAGPANPGTDTDPAAWPRVVTPRPFSPSPGYGGYPDEFLPVGGAGLQVLVSRMPSVVYKGEPLRFSGALNFTSTGSVAGANITASVIGFVGLPQGPEAFAWFGQPWRAAIATVPAPAGTAFSYSVPKFAGTGLDRPFQAVAFGGTPYGASPVQFVDVLDGPPLLVSDSATGLAQHDTTSDNGTYADAAGGVAAVSATPLAVTVTPDPFDGTYRGRVRIDIDEDYLTLPSYTYTVAETGETGTFTASAQDRAIELDLEPGRSYTITLQGHGLNGSNQDVVYYNRQIKVAVVAEPPMSIKVLASDDGGADVTWFPQTWHAARYLVQRTTDPNGANWVTVGTVLPPATSFHDTGLTPGTTYYYRVQPVTVADTMNPPGTAPTPPASLPAPVRPRQPGTPADPQPLPGGSGSVPGNDDLSFTDPVNLGFHINFYGKEYDQVYVNNNGNITFDGPLGTYTPFDLTQTTTPIIASFFGDVDTRTDQGPDGDSGSGAVTFGTTTVDGHKAFKVDWTNVGYYNLHSDLKNTFHLTLIDRSEDTKVYGDFDIIFKYDQLQWETGDASGGQDGMGGTPARAGYSNGIPGTFTSFEVAGSGESNGLLGMTSQMVYPIRNLDLQIDSSNSRGYGSPSDGRTLVEDQIEDDSKKPGKVVVANDDDGDSDGIPDFADGYNFDGVANADDNPPTAQQGEHFIPIVLKIPAAVDLSQARLRLFYDRSDPRNVDTYAEGLRRTGAGTESDPYSYIPGLGNLRLWTKDANTARTSRAFNLAEANESNLGFYIPPVGLLGAWYSPAELGLLGFGGTGDVRAVTVYAEVVRPSSTLAEQRITIQIDPDGGDDFQSGLTDAVRITSTQLAFINDVAANGAHVVDETDPITGYSRIGHWGEDVGAAGALPGGPVNGLNGYYQAGDVMPAGAAAEGVRNQVGSAANNWDNFIDRDPDRFYVRVVDANANTSPTTADTIVVLIGTLSATGSDDDSQNSITLRETGNNTAVFISESQLLTAPDLDGVGAADQDDGFAVRSSFAAGGGVLDGQANDRTHHAKIDGAMRISYGLNPDRRQIPVSRRDVDERKVLNIRAHVFRDPYRDTGIPGVAGTAGNGAFDWHDTNGDGVYSVGDASEPFTDINRDGLRNTVQGSEAAAASYFSDQLDRANIAWAQGGIKIQASAAIIFEEAPNDAAGNNVLADENFSLVDDRDRVVATAAGVVPDRMELYFVSNIGAGTRAFAAMPARMFPGVGENSFAFIGLNAPDPMTGAQTPLTLGTRTLAHEIGHLLENVPGNDGLTPNPPSVYFPANQTFEDGDVMHRRRITHAMEQRARTARAAGNLAAIGNRLLRQP
jgi:hypothetical protein